MKKKLLLVVSILLLLAVLVPSSVLAIAPSHVGPQNWQLNNTIAGSGVYQMAKYPGPNADKPHSTVPIYGHSSLIWIADQVSQGMTFPTGDGPWNVELITSQWDSADDTCAIQVGLWNGSVFSELPVDALQSDLFSLPGSPTTTIIKEEVQLTGFTVPSGQWLAIKVTNNDNSTYNINTGVGDPNVAEESASCVSSPSTDPGYPTPEVASIVLLGLGLVGLTGFGVFQYRKKRFSSINL